MMDESLVRIAEALETIRLCAIGAVLSLMTIVIALYRR